MKLIMTFYTDSGHGWLEVPRSILLESGVADKISHYSYQTTNRKKVYLEEDCDCSLFIDAMKAKGFEFEFKDSYSEDTFVRRLPRFAH